MANVRPFVMDGVEYDVSVMELTRKFSVLDSPNSTRTQDGGMYRDPIGTYYNYTLSVQRRGSDHTAFDRLWEALSAPVVSHVCTFPYNQHVLTQRMYVTSGEQKISQIYEDCTAWDRMTINFIAMEPKVVAR